MQNKVPRIVSIACSDHDPIEEWVPPDPEDVDIWLHLRIGFDGESSSDFQLHVLTQKALSSVQGRKDYSLVLPVYSWDALNSEIKPLLARCSGRDWSEAVDQLRKHMLWEYEGMK